MSAFEIEVESGKTVRLPTAGKYCDKDIRITAKAQEGGYDDGYTAGQQATLAQVWVAIQQRGDRTSYLRAFRGDIWYDDIYAPAYPIKGDCQQIFHTSVITDTKVPIVVDGSISYGFQASAMKTIRSLDLTDATTVNNCFYGASDVESITFAGLLKINGLNLSPCSTLSRDSLLSLFACLEDKKGDTSGTEWVVTLGSVNKTKLTAEELEIAANKGWMVK